MLGTRDIRRDPDIRWRRQPADLERFAGDQLALLLRAADVVRPGGRVVYATCSSEPDENETVVDAFLDRRPDFTLHDLRLDPSGPLTPLLDPAGRLRPGPSPTASRRFSPRRWSGASPTNAHCRGSWYDPVFMPLVSGRVWSLGKILLLIAALAATFLLFAGVAVRVALRAREVQVPRLTGHTVNEATQALSDLGLTSSLRARFGHPRSRLRRLRKSSHPK